MARVFISVLGTGNYQECVYCFNDEPACHSVRFVQEALINHLCKNWTEDDRIIIFHTTDSRIKNWMDDGHTDSKSGKKITLEGLNSRLGNLNLNSKPIAILIPDGKDETEIWKIFDLILENIQTGDEIFFDITHAFRSLPMLVMTVLNYAKVLKKVSLAKIYYGNYEARNITTNHAPIIDLSVFDQLLDWTFAIDGFLVAGDASRVKALADQTLAPVLEKTQGKDKSARTLKTIAGGLDRFSRDISTCRGPNISKDVQLLKQNIANYPTSHHLKALEPLIQLIGSKLATFKNDTLVDGLAATRWCLEHNLIQQGFTILQEAVVSYMIQLVGHDPKNVADRKIVTQTMGHHRCQRPEDKWCHESGANVELARSYYDLIDSYPSLSGVFNEVTEQRNSLNHAAWRREPTKNPKFYLRLADLANRLEAILIYHSREDC